MKSAEKSRRIRNMQIRSKTILRTQSTEVRVQQLILLVSDLLDLIATSDATRSVEGR